MKKIWKGEITFFDVEADTEEEAARLMAAEMRSAGFVLFVVQDHESLDELLHGHAFPAATPLTSEGV